MQPHRYCNYASIDDSSSQTATTSRAASGLKIKMIVNDDGSEMKTSSKGVQCNLNWL